MEKSAESVAELFYTRLKTTTNPGPVLAQLYGNLLDVNVGKSEIIMMNRLIKVFGKYPVFFAVLDVAKMGTAPDMPFPYLYAVCKNRLEATIDDDVSASSSIDLGRYINDLQKSIDKVKKVDPAEVSRLLDDERNIDGE